MFNHLKQKIVADSSGKEALVAILISGTLAIGIKIAGLIKEITIANYFGVSASVDFYVLALLVATFFVGPVSGTFGTLLTQKFVELKEKAVENPASLYCQILIFICLVFMLLVSAEIVLFNIPAIQQFFPRFLSFSSNIYLYPMLFIALFSGISTINRAVITAEKRFALFTVIPVVVPVSIVVSVAVDPVENMFLSLILGTVFGYFIEAVIGLFCNYKIWRLGARSAFNLSNKITAAIRVNFIPLFAAKMLMAGCLVVDQFMAVLAGEGAISIINYGNRIPLGILSLLAIIWTVLFPIFSELVSRNKHEQLLNLYNRSITASLIVLFVFGFIGFFLSAEIVSFLYQRGEFTAGDVAIVSKVQGYYFLYIPLYVLCLISIRIANSYEKPKFIVIGNAMALFLNIILNIFFISIYGVIGIAYATVLTYVITAIFWVVIARKLMMLKIKHT